MSEFRAADKGASRMSVQHLGRRGLIGARSGASA
jgi:hypothetical protein